MHSRAGVSLGVIATVDAKVAHIALQPRGTKICIACLDGSLAMLQLTFFTVHSLYQDLHACRYVSCSLRLNSLILGYESCIRPQTSGYKAHRLPCCAPVEPVAACGQPAGQVPA